MFGAKNAQYGCGRLAWAFWWFWLAWEQFFSDHSRIFILNPLLRTGTIFPRGSEISLHFTSRRMTPTQAVAAGIVLWNLMEVSSRACLGALHVLNCEDWTTRRYFMPSNAKRVPNEHLCTKGLKRDICREFVMAQNSTRLKNAQKHVKIYLWWLSKYHGYPLVNLGPET